MKGSKLWQRSTMNISLPENMKNWIEKQSCSGRYSNVSDYVRSLVRKDQERQAAIMALQLAIDEGMDSGAPQPFDRQAFKARMKQIHG